MMPARLLFLWALCALPSFADDCPAGECAVPARGNAALQHRRSFKGNGESNSEKLEEEAPDAHVEAVNASMLELSDAKAELEALAEGDAEAAEALRHIKADGQWLTRAREIYINWRLNRAWRQAYNGLAQDPRKLLRDWRQGFNDTYSFVRDGVAFGLKEDRDDRGPIGGGYLYKNIVPREKATKVIESNDAWAFVEAVKNAQNGDIIWVAPEVVIDFGSIKPHQAHGPWEAYVQVVKHITIASNRGEVGRAWWSASPGALLDFSKMPFEGKKYAIFSWKTLRLSGLRIKGPLTAEREWTGDGRGWPRTIGLGLDQAAEVDNCEIFAFNHACIKANYKGGKGYTYVHHSHLHSTHYSGLGYGVTTYESPLRVEFVQFERNRHAIASTGKPTASWEAHHIAVFEPNLHSAIDMHEPNGHYFQLWKSYIQGHFFFKERGTTVRVADSWARLNYIPGAENGWAWLKYRHEDCNAYRNNYIWSKCSTSVAKALKFPGSVKRSQKALLS